MTRQQQQTTKFVESQKSRAWSLTTIASGRFAAFAGDAGASSTTCPALRLIGTAYHEGGHVVASYAVWPQHPVESATIIPADGYLGMVRHAEQDDSWRADVEDEGMAAALAAESETVIYLAGHLAEVRFLDGIAEPTYRFPRTDDSLGALDASSDTWDGEAKPIHHVYAYWGRTRELLGQPGHCCTMTSSRAARSRRSSVKRASSPTPSECRSSLPAMRRATPRPSHGSGGDAVASGGRGSSLMQPAVTQVPVGAPPEAAVGPPGGVRTVRVHRDGHPDAGEPVRCETGRWPLRNPTRGERHD